MEENKYVVYRNIIENNLDEDLSAYQKLSKGSYASFPTKEEAKRDMFRRVAAHALLNAEDELNPSGYIKSLLENKQRFSPVRGRIINIPIFSVRINRYPPISE